MEELNKFQLLKLFLIAVLLIITPLLSTSHRRTYLYFIVNIGIIAIGAEAGLVSFFLKTPENKKAPNTNTSAAAQKPAAVIISSEAANSPDRTKGKIENNLTNVKDSSENMMGYVKAQKKSPSTGQSIVFIGVDESTATDQAEEDDDEAGEEVAEFSGQELFQKSENFIGNFYEQLKMQREESWKKLQDLYQKAF